MPLTAKFSQQQAIIELRPVHFCGLRHHSKLNKTKDQCAEIISVSHRHVLFEIK